MWLAFRRTLHLSNQNEEGSPRLFRSPRRQMKMNLKEMAKTLMGILCLLSFTGLILTRIGWFTEFPVTGDTLLWLYGLTTLNSYLIIDAMKDEEEK